MGPVPDCPHYPRILALAFAVGLLSACATEPVGVPEMPDESMLADAEAVLKEARDAGAAASASPPLREAQRKLAGARSILYRAAAASRELDAAERQRVRRLADEARLDARLALAETRRAEVEHRIDELRAKRAASSGEDGP